MLIPTLLSASAPIVKGLLDGSLVRYGGVIREASSGRIVKHLTESPGLTEALMHSPDTPILGGANPIINVLGRQVNPQIPGLLSSSAMGMSQIAAGASALNLGVSIIGFTYMHFRMNQLQNAIIDLKNTVEAGIRDIESRLDTLSGQLAYLKVLAEQSRTEILDAISELHRAIFIQNLAKLQAELASLARFPDSSPRDALKALTEARVFFVDQAHQIPTQRQARYLLLGDIALKGWAVSLATESQLLIKHGFVKDSTAILNSEVPRFRQLSQKWCEALLPDDRPRLKTAYTYDAPRFAPYISTERIRRIARLSPVDQSLTPEQLYRRKSDLDVEFQMSYFRDLDKSWYLTQVGIAEYLDQLSELTERLESLQAFAKLCESLDERDPYRFLPASSEDKGLYLI
ncbi:hypothetical protein [Thermostichus vulcanus]|uniref:Uncharacterized protein n=1 Tax=Thermostichus vulcanus str. 'Rupite' TaxID=2813851 RepID=A0ABT0CED5_THEVL|nr:hypothetical protein [Thermostichus vulcanus]MCJ2543700.1 hypothetical protein [Thermostichus vulcanus str. 'Rupite']